MRDNPAIREPGGKTILSTIWINNQISDRGAPHLGHFNAKQGTSGGGIRSYPQFGQTQIRVMPTRRCGLTWCPSPDFADMTNL